MTTPYAHLESRQAGRADTRLLLAARLLQIGVSRGLSSTLTLARSGLGHIDLIDNQFVEPENLGLTMFTAAQIGKRKVEAARELILAVAPAASINTFPVLAEDLTDLKALMAAADLVKIGIDNPAAQFDLADAAQAAGTPALVHGMTGDGQQFYASLVVPGGKHLRDMMPLAWDGVAKGFKPPTFFPSSPVYTEVMNAAVALMIAGVLHHRGGSTLTLLNDVGSGLQAAGLATGFNGFHEPSGFLTPIFFGLPD